MSQSGARLKPESDFSVVPCSNEHLPGLRELWREHFGEQAIAQRQASFYWLTAGNPLGAGRPGYYVLLDGSRVVGMHGHMPLEYRLGHERLSGYMAHDDLLASDYRGRGLGRVLLQAVSQQAPLLAGALWFNAPNLKLYGKSGWTLVPGFYPYLKILDPSPFLRRHLSELAGACLGPPARWLTGLRERLRFPRRSDEILISGVERFDPQVDALFERLCCRFGLIVTRSAAYLNWKFVEKPYGAYRLRVAYDQRGELRGYAVLKVGRTEGGLRGRIVDLLADCGSPAVFDALLEDACEQLAAAGVSYIEIASTYRPFLAALPRHGFIRARKPRGFMASRWEERFRPDFIRDIHSWYLTFSDADGDAWEPDVSM